MLFSGPMVRALLDGTKTQTRRAVKPQPFWVNLGDGQPNPTPLCPFGVVGDRLWVRETWAPDPRAPEVDGVAVYRATDEVMLNAHGARVDRWRPSIHMTRWASRITLEVTEVRVQRLRDISEEDALAEGVGLLLADEMGDARRAMTEAIAKSRVDGFRLLWESINGPGSWDANPWVWALTFQRGAQ